MEHRFVLPFMVCLSEAIRKYQNYRTAITTCELKTDILDSRDKTAVFQIRSSWAQFCRFLRFGRLEKMNKLRLLSTFEYSDSARRHQTYLESMLVRTAL